MMDDSDDFDDDDCIMLIVLKGQERNVQAQLLTQMRFIFSSSKVNQQPGDMVSPGPGSFPLLKMMLIVDNLV